MLVEVDVLRTMMRTSFSYDDITTLDNSVYALQDTFLATYGWKYWVPKWHWASHMAHDVLRFGPPRLTWCAASPTHTDTRQRNVSATTVMESNTPRTGA